MTTLRTKLGKSYTTPDGNRIQVVIVDGKTRKDVLVRRGTHGRWLLSNADAKAVAEAQVRGENVRVTCDDYSATVDASQLPGWLETLHCNRHHTIEREETHS